jgi:phosphoglycolate phosphatase-like HAD superfamily hydrolase
MRPIAVFDIDGVLADVRHRLDLLASTPKQWDAFFAAAVDDPLLADGAALVCTVADTEDIRYLTGRPESSRALTEAWLRRHDLPAGELTMRPDGDHRPARLFKVEQLRALRRGRTISRVIDDDPEVVALLRDQGLPVQQADWLPYASPLADAQESDGRT